MNTATLSTPDQIALYRLLALRQALKFEALGMKRRGRSANTIVCAELGLPKGTKIKDSLAALESLIEALKAEMIEMLKAEMIQA
jgi:hypothetical protein